MDGRLRLFVNFVFLRTLLRAMAKRGQEESAIQVDAVDFRMPAHPTPQHGWNEVVLHVDAADVTIMANRTLHRGLNDSTLVAEEEDDKAILEEDANREEGTASPSPDSLVEVVAMKARKIEETSLKVKDVQTLAAAMKIQKIEDHEMQQQKINDPKIHQQALEQVAATSEQEAELGKRLMHADGSKAEGCSLLGGFGILLQLALGFCCVGSLVVKWWFENPRRQWKIFCWDVGKICFGAGYVHCLNMVQARFFASGSSVDHNECAWYVIAVVCDCCISTVACYFVVKEIVRPALNKRGLDFGDYDAHEQEPSSSLTGPNGSPPPPPRLDCNHWLQQTGIWCMVITVVRLCIALVVFLLQGVFYSVGSFILLPVGDSQQGQLIVALFITPYVGNVFQFWVQDNFLKKQISQQSPHCDTEPQEGVGSTIQGRAASPHLNVTD